MNSFTALNEINCSKNVEKKGQFSYLSWPFAVAELGKAHPDATWEVKKFPLPDHPHCAAPYMQTPLGYFVEVEVDIGGVLKSQIHPVLDHRNKPVSNPDTFQVNTAIQRCLVKAIALHGLGLYIYAGEDLPEPSSETQGKETMDTDPIDFNKVNAAIPYLKKMIDTDDIEKSHVKIKEAWSKLSNDERMKVNEGLGDKAPDSNRMYKTLLKDYLQHNPDV